MVLALPGVILRVMERRFWTLRLLLGGRHTRGAVSTEYVVLVGTVGLAVMFSLLTAGPALVQGFERSRNILTAPFP